MSVTLVIILGVLFIFLLVFAAIRPIPVPFSRFELERRAARGNKAAATDLDRLNYRTDIATLIAIIRTLLVVAFSAVSVVAFGWLIGLGIAVVIVLEHAAIARLSFIRTGVKKLYAWSEPALFHFVSAAQPVLRFVRAAGDTYPDVTIGSKEELEHIIEASPSAFTTAERRLLTHALSFEEKPVSSVMSLLNTVDTIQKDEILGPLVLDDLHKTGHSRIPVIDGDINHIVGILSIQDVLIVREQRTRTAQEAMDPRVVYIRDDHTLSHALAAFLRMHRHLAIVINSNHETVGVLTLEDVVEALIGRKIIDEFDADEDRRMVARRVTQ